MSSFWKPPVYDVRGRETQWINNTIQAHDIFCGCNEPGNHLLLALAERSAQQNISKDTLQTATKCLSGGDHTGEEPTGQDEEDGGFGIGDLEKLFAEDEDTNG